MEYNFRNIDKYQNLQKILVDCDDGGLQALWLVDCGDGDDDDKAIYYNIRKILMSEVCYCTNSFKPAIAPNESSLPHVYFLCLGCKI